MAEFNVQFVNRSVGAISYLWDFGDGKTSTEENPLHVYAAPGLYTVTLSAVGPTGERLLATVWEVLVGSVIDAVESADARDQLDAEIS